MRAYPGLKPWDLDRMWPAEIDELIRDVNRQAQAARRAEQRSR